MKKQNGITLIALVISIIVMLILAGVSINAIVGENGVLSRAQYSSFMNEMAAVEEAVQLWKAGELIDSKGQVSTAIPANGLCKVNDLTATERLVGEIGYYRTWNLSQTTPKTRPNVDILNSSDSSFNSRFESELVFYPAGIQDLYYLNNEALNLDDDKVYLIDASTSIVYSMTGISINGVRCYSSHMAKAVMSGTNSTPVFAEAEVEGAASGEALAGNVSTEYIDENGKPIYKRPDGTFVDALGNVVDPSKVQENNSYNENGFKIIASSKSNNIFKLYNTGELYGKGIKGIQLNTSKEEMDKITPYAWKEFEIPTEIGGYKKIYPTQAGVFLIDNNDDAWSIGNSYGLTYDQRVEYTGREWVKLDLGSNASGKKYKAKKIFGTSCCVYIVTTTNELLGTGTNEYGQLGTNDKVEKTDFVKINGIPNPDTIQSVSGSNYSGSGGQTIIKCTDASGNNQFYLSGTDVLGGLGFGIPHSISSTSFIEIFNGQSGRGNNIANDLNDIITGHHENCLLWFKNGEIYWTGWAVSYVQGKWNVPKVIDVRWSHTLIVLKCDNNGVVEYYAANGRNSNNLGPENYHTGVAEAKKISIPNGLEIKDFDIYYNNAIYFLDVTGDVYGIGLKTVFGNIDDYVGWTNFELTKLTTISGINSIFSDKFDVRRELHGTLFLVKDGKYYITNDTNLMYKNDLLQKTWTLVAENVLEFDASNNAYITRDHNVYVAGSDSRTLGLGEDSEIQKSIDNYTMITQPEIAGKAKSVYQFDDATYILTVDNELYAAGRAEARSSEFGLRGYEKTDESGWIYEDQTTYVKIKDEVLEFIPSNGWYCSKAYISTSGKLYALGRYIPFLGGYLSDPTVWTELSFPEAIGNVENVKKWISKCDWRSFVLGNDGKMYMGGTWTAVFGGGQSLNGYNFTEFTYGVDLTEGEKIIDIASIGQNSCMMLTNNGRLFGFGPACYLGINNTGTELITNKLISSNTINGKKLVQIEAGANFYIAVDEDGNVYGTGNNKFGTLGRWKGTDRTPSSRYRSAFEWVACPELEI